MAKVAMDSRSFQTLLDRINQVYSKFRFYLKRRIFYSYFLTTHTSLIFFFRVHAYFLTSTFNWPSPFFIYYRNIPYSCSKKNCAGWLQNLCFMNFWRQIIHLNFYIVASDILYYNFKILQEPLWYQILVEKYQHVTVYMIDCCQLSKRPLPG